MAEEVEHTPLVVGGIYAAVDSEGRHTGEISVMIHESGGNMSEGYLFSREYGWDSPRKGHGSMDRWELLANPSDSAQRIEELESRMADLEERLEFLLGDGE